MGIYLLGYMGSGKSTVGKLLAKQLLWDFLDFDQYIVLKEGMSISEIFDLKGEIYFRKKEIDYLQEVLKDKSTNNVVALGGGTPCYGSNMEDIKASGHTSIYLHLPFQELVSRLWDEKEHRPMIASMTSKEALEDFIPKHLFERSYFYNQADHTIRTTGLTPEEAVRQIVARLF